MTPVEFLRRVGRRAGRVVHALRHGYPGHPPLLGNDKVFVVPFPVSQPVTRLRVAVVVHVHFIEVADALRAACANVPAPCDILLTTDTDAKACVLRTLFAGWSQGQVHVTVIPNRGRDLPSKLVTYRDAFGSYDVLLCLHSKRSRHLAQSGEQWSRVLLETLAGSTEIVSSVLALFATCEDVGLVYADHFDGIRQGIDWGDVRRAAGATAQRLQINLRRVRALEFPSGSMFWVRPAALQPLLDLGLRYDSFPPEHGQLDGTLAHVLERLVTYAAERAGYRWLKIVRTDHYRDRGNRVLPGADLRAAVDAVAVSLLPEA